MAPKRRTAAKARAARRRRKSRSVLTHPTAVGYRRRAVPTPLLKDGWLIPDAMWALVEPLLPARKKHPLGCHNPRADDRKAMNTIAFVLRTATPWHQIPKNCPDLCGGSSAYRRYHEWKKAGVFKKLWVMALDECHDHKLLDWRFLVMDGCITKAPHGGEDTGKNPVDRSKVGTKRSLLTEGNGFPVGLVVAGANRNDCKLVQATLASMPLRWPRSGDKPLMLMDKGYDSDEVRGILKKHGLKDGIIRRRKKGEAEPPRKPRTPGHKPRRWVVERTHAWMNCFRRVKTRWERRSDSYLGMLHLTAALVTFQRLTGGRGDLSRCNRRRDHAEFIEWEKVPRRARRTTPQPAWRLPGAA